MLIFSFKKSLLISLSAIVTILVNSISYAVDFDFFSKNMYCKGLSSSIEKYACLTEHAAKGIELYLISNGIHLKSHEVSMLKAIEAMNLVQNIASVGRIHYLIRTPPHPLPKSPLGKYHSKFQPPSMDKQDICLTNGFGCCGNHQFLFIAILKRIGIKARPVDLYYSVNGRRYSHAVAEVKINNKWGYFDITWGSYWLSNQNDLLSIESLEDILNGKGKQMINSNNSMYVAMTSLSSLIGLPSVFAYLNAADLQILRNKSGILLISFNNNEANFSNQPNFFGKTSQSILKMKLSGNAPSGDATIDISAFGGDCKQSCMKVGSKCYPVINGKSRISISPNSVIEIEGKDSICYAVIASLKTIN